MNNIFANASILWLTTKKLPAYSEQDSAAEHATEIRQYKPMDITPQNSKPMKMSTKNILNEALFLALWWS